MKPPDDVLQASPIQPAYLQQIGLNEGFLDKKRGKVSARP